MVEGGAGRGGGGSPAQVKHLDPYPIAEVHQHKSRDRHPIAEVSTASQPHCRGRYSQHRNPIAEVFAASQPHCRGRYSQHLNPIAEGGVHSIATPLLHSISTTSKCHKSSISTTSTSPKSSISTTSTSPKSSISTTSTSHKSSISTTSSIPTRYPQAQVASQASQPQAQVTSQASGSLPHCKGRYPHGHHAGTRRQCTQRHASAHATPTLPTHQTKLPSIKISASLSPQSACI